MAEQQYTGQIYIAFDQDDDPRVRWFVQFQQPNGSALGTGGFGETAEEALAEAWGNAGWQVPFNPSRRQRERAYHDIEDSND